MKLGIFEAFDNYHKYYVRACDDLRVDYEVIDIIAPDWLERIHDNDCDGFLCRPPSKFQERKSMFDEKLYVINKLLKKPIYPSFDELLIYENKRMTSYWLDIHKIPHPETRVFYRKKDYLDFLKETKYPFVIKSNIGSTSKGVSFVKNTRQARKLAGKYFGVFNPKLARGHTFIQTGKIIPVMSYGSKEKHFIIVQKYYDIKWEWRIVKIEESYFGHRKLLSEKFASGSHLKGWGAVPEELLFLIKKICEAGDFFSMALDIFETKDGTFLVNEMQSMFGQKTPHLLLVDEMPGRYIYQNGEFIFENGEFNQNQSYNLRVKHFLKILESA